MNVTANAVGEPGSSCRRVARTRGGEGRRARIGALRRVRALILKVSYNIGADTSLMLYGVTQGADSMPASLAAEKKTLADEFGIEAGEFAFVDGSGGGESAATPTAIVSFLRRMRGKPFFETYRDCLPILATDGSLAFVTDFMSDPSLAGAKGKVHAKTGTYLVGGDNGVISLRAQAFAGYIDAKSGRRLAYALFVNDVSPVSGLDEVMQVFQDQGTISAIIGARINSRCCAISRISRGGTPMSQTWTVPT